MLMRCIYGVSCKICLRAILSDVKWKPNLKETPGRYECMAIQWLEWEAR